jgi:phosphinothricin acetyltransferase
MIRPVTIEDAADICRIYAPAVTREDVATSFELEVPGPDEIAARIEKKMRIYPWLVFEDGGTIVGYAYADPHRDRAAYQWGAEVSVYVDQEHHRKGVGRQLYHALFEILKAQGVINLYAGITLPNQGSVFLHESLGFQQIGVYRSIGYKFGKAHDVGWWHLALREWPNDPSPIVPYSELDQRL